MRSVLALAVLKLALQLAAGPEYDSNANRAEVVAGATSVDPPTASALFRTTFHGALDWRAGAQLLFASLDLGGKVFFNPDVSDQDVLVGQLGIEDRWRVRDWLELGGLADYYDASQAEVAPPCAASGCDRHRDFRSGDLLARLALIDAPGRLVVSAGYRGFQYKPDATFDFQALVANVTTSVRFSAGSPESPTEWDLRAAYHLERRLFAGPEELNLCAPGAPLTALCLSNGPRLRTDWFHEGTIELTYLRSVLVTLGYALELEDSSSFGQSLLRHLITLKIATGLPFGLYATAKAQLLVTGYLDPVLLDREVNTQTFVSIEDENRNAAIVDLERPFFNSGFAVDARYSLFTNEISPSPASFLRQTLLVGFTYGLTRTSTSVR